MLHSNSEGWEQNRKPILIVLVIWVLSSPLFAVLLLFVPHDLFLIYVGGWIAVQFLFVLVLAVLGGWQIALGASVILLWKLLIPVTLLALFLPLPNPLTVVFLFISGVLVGIMILSSVCWKLAYRFSDPHLIQGGAVVGILGGTIWLIVFVILWFYLSML
ncbi:MAG: hypothetical protein ACFE8O_09955 [Candidatus Hermodarchaeota archaeon]